MAIGKVPIEKEQQQQQQKRLKETRKLVKGGRTRKGKEWKISEN